MRRLLSALLVSGLAMSVGTSGALAGGSADSSGEGSHCYLFFVGIDDNEGFFAQAMLNDLDPDVVLEKRNEFIIKYQEQGFALDANLGNLQNLQGSDEICAGAHGETSETDYSSSSTAPPFGAVRKSSLPISL